ncbi:MAG: SPOR domain-containing protein [Candidatus Neomarinimicrobiota bacterium]
MIYLKKYNFILIAALAISCSKENNTVAIGETINVSAKIPEESQDLEFIWELTSVPENSFIDNNNIQIGDTNSSIDFTPDIPGTYSLEVSIFQYNDEISTESFSYNVVPLESNKNEETVENIVIDEEDSSAVSDLLVDYSEPKWYDAESIDDVLDEVEKTPLKENIEVELIKEEPIVKKTITKPNKKTSKKIIKKSKVVRGSSIPFDKDRFTIQVGSKKFLSDAKKFAAQLIDSGYDAYIQKASFKETNEVWYRIRVGSYDKRETATAVAKVLSKTRQEKAWVDFVRYEY